MIKISRANKNHSELYVLICHINSKETGFERVNLKYNIFIKGFCQELMRKHTKMYYLMKKYDFKYVKI